MNKTKQIIPQINNQLEQFKSSIDVMIQQNNEYFNSIKRYSNKTFDIEIIEAKSQTNKDVKGIKFEVVDEDLLSKTGGIIQGMSGSPIIQDGKLIGAVSHVLVDDSKVGFGVYSEFMLAFT